MWFKTMSKVLWETNEINKALEKLIKRKREGTMYIGNGRWDITADAAAIKKDNENIMTSQYDSSGNRKPLKKLNQ